MSPKLPQPISDEALEKWKGKSISISLISGRTLHGKLLRYDAESLIISDPPDHPETVVRRETISTYQEYNGHAHKPRRS